MLRGQGKARQGKARARVRSGATPDEGQPKQTEEQQQPRRIFIEPGKVKGETGNVGVVGLGKLG